MSAWTCPRCHRLFGRRGQAHECTPGLSLEAYFSTGPAHERPVFDAVWDHVRTLGPVHADIVSVGIFLKNPHTFAQLRPMQRWVALWFPLPRRARHASIVRKPAAQGPWWWHVANLAEPDDLDDALRELLDEAYRARAGDEVALDED